MTARACAFITHAGFATLGRLAIPVLYFGAGIGSRLRIAARIVRFTGLHRTGCPDTMPDQLHVSQAFHMIGPFIQ